MDDTSVSIFVHFTGGPRQQKILVRRIWFACFYYIVYTHCIIITMLLVVLNGCWDIFAWALGIVFFIYNFPYSVKILLIPYFLFHCILAAAANIHKCAIKFTIFHIYFNGKYSLTSINKNKWPVSRQVPFFDIWF